ncbi:MAG TPA: hypothetical protein EYG15_02260, partial [Deltaproteobacteria bacterium]|nr:hypothetical protein [Deltaproteobacteria bacterium]
MLNFDFSPNNSMTEFESPETDSTVYLGFASDPVPNVFSQKFRGSPHASTTETLVRNLELLKLPEDREGRVILHLVQGSPTLDGATAAFALTRNRDELSSRSWINLGNYISEMEKGYTSPPFLRSLYSFYYATYAIVSADPLYQEVCNCRLEVLNGKTAQITFPDNTDYSVENDAFILLSNASNQYLNGRFRVLSVEKLNIVIEWLSEHTFNDFWSESTVDGKFLFIGEQTAKKRNQEVLTRYHEALDAFWKADTPKGPDSFRNFMDLLPKTISTTGQEESINGKKQLFIDQDFLKGECFEVDLPLRNQYGFQTHQRVPLLAIQDPQSQYFKFFARNPMRYPGSSEDLRYPLTYVHNSQNKGHSSEHVISVPPLEQYSLKGFSELIEKIEDHCRQIQGEQKRPKDNCRLGYDYNDPWYDERETNHSIMDNPRDGSRLDRVDVLESLWHFGCPLERVKVTHTTTSIFIPFWEDQGIEKLFCDTTQKDWSPYNYTQDFQDQQSEIKHVFLPFVENIFKTTNLPPDEKGSLQAWKYNGDTNLNLLPRHTRQYAQAVSVIRKITQEKIEELIKQPEVKSELRIFSYEYGLGLINLEINIPKIGFSIMDSQWLEHLICITRLEDLLQNVRLSSGKKLDEEFKGKLLAPYKHYACTTLTDFRLEGGSLTDCRSVGAGLQMVVNDAEPLFHNLPRETRLATHQTVVDEVTKRHYYCSSSSMLNFDDEAYEWEHQEAHSIVSIIFNMVLAQRFLLSKARTQIVEKEWEYNEDKHKTTFWPWLKTSLGFLLKGSHRHSKESPELEIRKIREQIQHMTTSSWFNVISTDSSIQKVFMKLREQMNVQEFYKEVLERCNDLDEWIASKQASVQSRVFNIFTFVISPFSLVIGFMGGYYFTSSRPPGFDIPFPF